MARAQQETEANYSLEVMPGHRIARFHWIGPITTRDRYDNVRRMVSFCREKGIRSLLIDGRDQEAASSTIDDFDFAKNVPFDMRGLRIAVVHSADDEALQFIETVAFNRGGNTQSFIGVDEAVAWLEALDKIQ